jgi:hypothetical protein
MQKSSVKSVYFLIALHGLFSDRCQSLRTWKQLPNRVQFKISEEGDFRTFHFKKPLIKLKKKMKKKT